MPAQETGTHLKPATSSMRCSMRCSTRSAMSCRSPSSEGASATAAPSSPPSGSTVCSGAPGSFATAASTPAHARLKPCRLQEIPRHLLYGSQHLLWASLLQAMRSAGKPTRSAGKPVQSAAGAEAAGKTGSQEYLSASPELQACTRCARCDMTSSCCPSADAACNSKSLSPIAKESVCMLATAAD